MSEKIFTVVERKFVEELLANTKELIGFYNQEAQHDNALKEIRKIIDDIKNKRITKINFPSLGGLMITKSATNRDVKKLLDTKEKEIANSLKGIRGQIAHREDILAESYIRSAHVCMNRLRKCGIEPCETNLKKIYEKPEKKE